MAFEEIVPAEKAATGTGVSVGLAKLRAGRALLRVSMHLPVMLEMGWLDGEKLVALLGTGEDHGLLRLRKDKAGAYKAGERVMRGGAYYQVSLGHRPEFVDRSEKAVPCQWEKVDLVTIEIALPQWADETKPKAKAAISATPPAVLAGRRDTAAQEAERKEAEKRRAARERGVA